MEKYKEAYSTAGYAHIKDPQQETVGSTITYYPNPHPCPTCGRCPTCGKGNYWPYYYPYYVPYQPFWPSTYPTWINNNQWSYNRAPPAGTIVEY